MLKGQSMPILSVRLGGGRVFFEDAVPHCPSLISGALAVPQQPKNSGAATAWPFIRGVVIDILTADIT